MAKRGSSGLSFVVAINKEEGMSSHDVVNRCRKIFSERRIGHAGTLDPAAQGVLLVCIGPATRLNSYLTSQEKGYRFKVLFGSETDTDDREGTVTATKTIPPELFDPLFAVKEVEKLVGKHKQVPPAYSAIKVDGKRAYEAARSGEELALKKRNIQIFESKLLSLDSDSEHPLVWEIFVRVSKGTYVRSLARDLGRRLGTYGHVLELERISSGCVSIEGCATLSELERSYKDYLIDPVKVLGFTAVVPTQEGLDAVSCGAPIREKDIREKQSFENRDNKILPCKAPAILENSSDFSDGELVSIVSGDTLFALYSFDSKTRMLNPRCVFSIGVSRGNS